MRKTRILVGAGVAAVCGALLAAAPAQADSTACTPSGCAGKAEFVSYGEHLWVYDMLADGHSAVARYWLQGGTGPFSVWSSGGTGTAVDADLDLAEGSWIYYQVCLGEAATRTIIAGSCNAGVTDYA
ncbi:hypothetical protein [Dactylosporangium sp. NPDC049140]|uniref:hypothetical protein n=1 Tax=Dactylosporangium sp. NPDC049140 TaxID=3155647 RepID=UPI0033E21060